MQIAILILHWHAIISFLTSLRSMNLNQNKRHYKCIYKSSSLRARGAYASDELNQEGICFLSKYAPDVRPSDVIFPLMKTILPLRIYPWYKKKSWTRLCIKNN